MWDTKIKRSNWDHSLVSCYVWALDIILFNPPSHPGGHGQSSDGEAGARRC